MLFQQSKVFVKINIFFQRLICITLLVAGYTDENFFTLNSANICDLLNDEDFDYVFQFVSTFSFVKGRKSAEFEFENNNTVQIEETNTLKFISNKSSPANLHEKTFPQVPNSSDNISKGNSKLPIIISSLFSCQKFCEFSFTLFFIAETFPKNDLYDLLNSSLYGKIILSKYKETKVLYSNKLKPIIIWNRLNDDDILDYK